MDLTVHEAIDDARKALEVAIIVGAWSEAARIAERLGIYCALAASNEQPVPEP